MTEPITPPPELRKKWLNESPHTSEHDYLIDKAAQWGADQELEACAAQLSQCCLLTNEQRSTIAEYLHFCRRTVVQRGYWDAAP